MKKFFALLLALSMTFALVACGSNDNTNAPSSDAPGVTEPGDINTGDEAAAPDGDSSADGDDTIVDGDDQPALAPTETPDSSGGTTTDKPASGTTAPKPEAPAAKPAPAQKSLTDLMDAILKDVDAPGSSTTALTAEQFPAYLFIDQPAGAEAVTADALIGSIAHSVVLMRLEDGADVADIAKQIKDKADPRKWICVAAEKTEVKTNGNLVLLVMSDAATTDAIAANFAALSV